MRNRTLGFIGFIYSLLSNLHFLLAYFFTYSLIHSLLFELKLVTKRRQKLDLNSLQEFQGFSNLKKNPWNHSESYFKLSQIFQNVTFISKCHRKPLTCHKNFVSKEVSARRKWFGVIHIWCPLWEGVGDKGKIRC